MFGVAEAMGLSRNGRVPTYTPMAERVSEADHKAGRDLYWAAKKGDVDSVKALVAAGASVRWGSDTNNGVTALHAASSKGHCGCISPLIDAGADVNVLCDSKNKSAVARAAEEGHLDAVRLLLGAGADPKVGHPALALAVQGLETARRTLANKQKIESPAVPKYAAVVESFEQIITLLDASKAKSTEGTEREEEDDEEEDGIIDAGEVDDLISLLLRPHGGGMPGGRAASVLCKAELREAVQSFLTPDEWDILGGFGALTEIYLGMYLDDDSEYDKLVDAFVKRPAAISLLLLWIAYPPALDEASYEERFTLTGFDYDSIRYKDVRPDSLLGPCAAKPIIRYKGARFHLSQKGHQPLYTAYEYVMKGAIQLLSLLTNSPNALALICKSKQTWPVLQRLVERIPADFTAIQCLRQMCEAHVGVRCAVLRIPGARDKVAALPEYHKYGGNRGRHYLGGPALLALLDGVPTAEEAARSPSDAVTAFDALGSAALAAGLVVDGSAPGAFAHAQRNLSAFVDGGARDLAAYTWLDEYVLHAGATVEIAGLTGRPALNGRVGTIKGPSLAGADGGRRYPVVLEEADDKAKGGVRVRATNLQLPSAVKAAEEATAPEAAEAAAAPPPPAEPAPATPAEPAPAPPA